MPKHAKEHVTDETSPMTTVQYSSLNYCPFEASCTDAVSYPVLAAWPYLDAYQQSFRAIPLIQQ